MTEQELFERRSANGRKSAQARFDRTGYFISPLACKIGGHLTIHARFHAEKFYENCPVCNGTLEQLQLELEKERNHMSRNTYKVVSVDAHSLNLTDGTSWQGEMNIVRCTRHSVENAQVGDRVSAEINQMNPTIVNDPFLEVGAGAAALKPAPFVPEIPKPFNPNDTGDAPLLYPDGSPLSARDIDTMLREQAKTIASLVARVTRLEALAPRHCSRCLGCLALEQGAFERR